jgi:hypothetical protein
MDESMTHDISQISVKKYIILTIDFVGKEVFEPISQIENNKAPSPDGFSARRL